MMSAKRLLGALMAHWRNLRGYSLGDVERELRIDGSNLSKMEQGKRLVPEPVLKDLDRFYEASGLLIAVRDLVISVDRMTGVSGESDIGHAEDVDKVRRQLLATLAALSGAAVLPVEGIGNLRFVIDRHAASTSVQDWEEIAWEYAHRLKSQPITDVIYDLTLDVADLQKIFGSVDRTAGWGRVDAQFKFLLARALGLAGQSREARHWWNTARHAAQESGDRQLVALCRGWESTHGMHENRPPALLLAHTEEALAVVDGVPCAGAAEALTAQAQIRSMLGDDAGARRSLDQQARIFERLPASVTEDRGSLFGWPVTRMLHTRAYVATRGDHGNAAQVQEEALNAYAPTDLRAITQVKLYQARAQVAGGDVGQGMAHARDALGELPPDQRTLFTHYSATLVLHAVPAELDRRARPAVEEYRELLALPQPSQKVRDQ